jgi:hypothetical protein
MRPSIERSYRLLLRAAPTQLQAEHGEEILTTLAEATPPDRRVPPAMQAAALVVEGLRARARLAVAGGPAQVWADGLYYGALLLTLTNLGRALGPAGEATAGGLASAATLAGAALALLLARPGVGLALLVPAAVLAARSLGQAGPTVGTWSELTRLTLPVALAGALVLPPLAGRVRRRPLGWLLLPVLLEVLTLAATATVAAGHAVGLVGEVTADAAGVLITLLHTMPEFGLVVTALALALMTADPRPAVAAYALALPGVLRGLAWAGMVGPLAGLYLLPLLVCLVLLAWAALQALDCQRAQL